jgi:heavy metal sensor kinase
MLSKRRHRYFGRLDVKLTVYCTLIVFSSCAALSVFLHYRLQRNLVKQVDRMLSDELHELLQIIGEDNSSISTACECFEDRVRDRRFYPIYFKLYDEQGNELCSSANAMDYRLPLSARRYGHEYTHVLPASQEKFRVHEQHALRATRERVIVQIATELKEAGELLEQFDGSVVRSLFAAILVSLLIGMLVARKPRRLIHRIAAVADRVSGSNLGERLSLPAGTDDIGELSATINAMLDRLERAFAEIRQFNADVSHELRTPLFAMKGAMEVALSKARESGEYRDVLTECHERIQLLIKTVNDLFLVSRFESNAVTLDVTYLNLKDVVRDIHELYLPMAQEKQVRLSLGPCDEAVIQADKAKIPRLVSNLLDNAIKFTPAGGEITITLLRQAHGVELSLRDTGIGVPPDELHYIFNRFYQTDKSRSGAGRGAGLGLHICKKIAEAHGGALQARLNEQGRGMTFIVTLPTDA